MLFSYRVRWDDGAAPNPFGERCTLVICKPGIRRIAEVGDWIAGTGAITSGLPDAENRLVYAMRVTRKLTMADYDAWTHKRMPIKVPNLGSSDQRRWVGDSIYDFSTDPPRQRAGVHTEANRETDLGGTHALLSDDFVYFGRNAVWLPKDLLPIVKAGQGHKSRSNEPYVTRFAEWVRSLDSGAGTVAGDPIMWPLTLGEPSACAAGRRKEAMEDEMGSQSSDTGSVHNV